MKRLHCFWLLVGLLTWVLSGCTSTPLTTAEVAGDKTPAAFEGGPSTPIPTGAVLKPAKSLILGQGDQWVGRMALDVGRDADVAYKFFYEVYPAKGGNLITAEIGRAHV